MADELDLERGDPTRADDRSERRARRRNREPSASSSSSSDKRTDTEITSRLDRVLDRIAKTLEARNDEELAEVIREDGAAMGQGLTSLTGSFKGLRLPLIMLLNLVEPLLAFGRVVRILARRWMERRYRKQAEREQAIAEAEAANNGGGGEVGVFS